MEAGGDQSGSNVPAEGDDDRLVLYRQHRGFRLLWPGRAIGCRCAALPLGDGLLIDPVPFGQSP